MPADALAVLLGQRACRRFAPGAVDPADLRTILEAATHAPSSQNSQPWIFVVIESDEGRDAVAGITRDLWRAGGRAHAAATLAPRLLADVDDAIEVGFGGAPTLVVVAGDGRDGTPARLLASSVFPAVQSMLLAAAALGYGSSLTTLAAMDPARLAAATGLPDGVVPFAVVPLGRPARPLGPPRRRPVEEVAHRERFGNPFTGHGSQPLDSPAPGDSAATAS